MRNIAIILIIFALASCGGGGGTPDPDPVAVNPAGAWQIWDTAAPTDINTWIIDGTRPTFDLYQGGAPYEDAYVATLTFTGNNFTIDGTVAEAGSVFHYTGNGTVTSTAISMNVTETESIDDEIVGTTTYHLVGER